MDSEAFVAASLPWVDLIVSHQNIWHPQASFIEIGKIMNRILCPSLSIFR